MLAAFLSLIALPARSDDSSTSDQIDESSDYIDEIIVTGSRIARRNLFSTSPLTQLYAENLEMRGVTRVEDALNALPQVFPDQTAFVNFADVIGTATVNLRGLGASRALVLMNGRRLPGTGSSDINQIPGALIDRVEVLTGGASATYGSDAVTGVANFITRTDFRGLEFEYLYGLYQHRNKNTLAQAALHTAGFTVPSASVLDGATHNISLLYGVGDGEPGNLALYANYRHTDSVKQSERDHSACALYDDGAGGWQCGGSTTIPEGLFTDWGELWWPPSDENGNPLPPWNTQPWPGSFEYVVAPGSDQFVEWDDNYYNYSPLNYFMRPDETLTFGALGHYDFDEALAIYFESHFMRYESVAQIAPSGSFFKNASLHCGNPLMSPQQFDLLCGQYNLTTDNRQTAYVGRRNVEGGPRQTIVENDSDRIVVGVRGTLGPRWSYDVFANYGENRYRSRQLNDLSVSRLSRALDVVADPISGEAVCTSVMNGTDPNCVPWNVFGTGPVTQAALDYMSIAGEVLQNDSRLQISGFLSGRLGDDWQLPFAQDGVRVIFGLEYRDESLDFSPSDEMTSGDFAGLSLDPQRVYGTVNLWEIFTEARIPIVEARRWAELAALEIGYRYSDYSTGATAHTYKVAGEWMFNPSLRIRGSLQRAIRAANVSELFQPVFDNFWWDVDTCIGESPQSTLEECLNTGLTAAQYGTLLINAASFDQERVNTIMGGNPELDPEEADTISFGFVVTPPSHPRLSFSVDYFNVKLENAIEIGNAPIIFDQCLATGASEYCDKINRDPATGWLIVGDAHIDLRNTNIALLQTSGVDAIADYGFGIGRAGEMQLSLILTYLDELKYQAYPGSETFDCAGVYQRNCWEPSHKWAGNLTTTWLTPWDANVTLNWRYTGKVRDLWEDADKRKDTEAMNHFDLAAVWNLRDSVALRLGVNNLFDADPPTSFGYGAGVHNGNTFPGSYDPLGRYWFASVSLRH